MTYVTYTACLFDGADCSEEEVECQSLGEAVKVCRDFAKRAVRPKPEIVVEEWAGPGATNQTGEYWIHVDAFAERQLLVQEDIIWPGKSK